MAAAKKRKSTAKKKTARKAAKKPHRFEHLKLLVGVIVIAGIAVGAYIAGSRLWLAQESSTFSNVVLTNPTPSAPPTPLPADWQPVSEYAVPILMYHHIGPKPVGDPIGEGLTVSEETFGKQLDYLKAHGYTPILFSQLRRMVLPPKPVILTFDDGYVDAYKTVFPMLQKRNMNGVFYVVSGFVGNNGYVTWEQLKDMQEGGMEVGAHSRTHVDLAKSSVTEQHDQIYDSIKKINEELVTPVLTFAYPSGQWNPDTVNLVRAAGVIYSVTTAPGVASSSQDQELLPRIRMENKTDLSLMLP